MAFLTNRHNIEPMFWFVTVPMMILLSRFMAIITQLSNWARQFTYCYCVSHGIACFPAFRMAKTRILACTPLSNFPFWSLSIIFVITLLVSYESSFVFLIISLGAGVLTIFTPIFVTIRTSRVFVKFRKLFEILAFRATFCLNCLSHNVLSLSKNVLVRVDCRHIPAVGSSYYTGGISFVK